MPILNIEIVGRLSAPLDEKLAQRLADAAGDALKAKKNGAWVRVHFLNKELYAENGQGESVFSPVFVHVIHGTLPSQETLREQSKGRVAFGGRLLE